MKWSEHSWGIIRNYTVGIFILLYVFLTILASLGVFTLCSFSHPMDVHLPDGSERELKSMHDGGKAERQERAERAIEKERSGQELSDREQRDVFEHIMKDTV